MGVYSSDDTLCKKHLRPQPRPMARSLLLGAQGKANPPTQTPGPPRASHAVDNLQFQLASRDTVVTASSTVREVPASSRISWAQLAHECSASIARPTGSGSSSQGSEQASPHPAHKSNACALVPVFGWRLQALSAGSSQDNFLQLLK